MAFGVFFGGVAVLVLAFVMMRNALRLQKAAREYEFNNRTTGGVVQFATFDDSVRHEMRKRRGGLLGGAGALGLVLGLVMLMAGCQMMSDSDFSHPRNVADEPAPAFQGG